MPSKYRIRLSGCDDETEFEMDLDTDQAVLMHQVALKSKAASGYGCQPTLSIDEIKEPTNARQ